MKKIVKIMKNIVKMTKMNIEIIITIYVNEIFLKLLKYLFILLIKVHFYVITIINKINNNDNNNN